MERVTCGECRWGDRQESGMFQGQVKCRRYVPSGEHSKARWPVVEVKDWCGEGERHVA